MLMVKKPMDPNLKPLGSIGPMAMICPKSKNSKLGHLSIKNFVLNEAQLNISSFEVSTLKI
jgi:hypothetical protein